MIPKNNSKGRFTQELIVVAVVAKINKGNIITMLGKFNAVIDDSAAHIHQPYTRTTHTSIFLRGHQQQRHHHHYISQYVNN